MKRGVRKGVKLALRLGSRSRLRLHNEPDRIAGGTYVQSASDSDMGSDTDTGSDVDKDKGVGVGVGVETDADSESDDDLRRQLGSRTANRKHSRRRNIPRSLSDADDADVGGDVDYRGTGNSEREISQNRSQRKSNSVSKTGRQNESSRGQDRGQHGGQDRGQVRGWNGGRTYTGAGSAPPGLLHARGNGRGSDRETKHTHGENVPLLFSAS